MDYKYARFVSFATIIAHETLRRVLRGSDDHPSPNVLRDAAQIGAKRARERLFPGLPRDPFTINPVDDIVLGLRYYYEPKPEPSPVPPKSNDSTFDSEYYLAQSRGTPPKASDLQKRRDPSQTAFPFAPKDPKKNR